MEDCGALQFGEFTLASGAKSDYYIDVKKAITNPKTLQIISQLMAKKMIEENICPDKIAGVVLGSIPLAVALSLEMGIPYIMVRKEKKDHGTSKLIEGNLIKGNNVLVIEDVITTAGSSIHAIKIIRESGGIVNRIFSVIDREGGGRESLREIDVDLISLVKGSDMVKDRK